MLHLIDRLKYHAAIFLVVCNGIATIKTTRLTGCMYLKRLPPLFTQKFHQMHAWLFLCLFPRWHYFATLHPDWITYFLIGKAGSWFRQAISEMDIRHSALVFNMPETKITKHKHHSKEEEERVIEEMRRKRQEKEEEEGDTIVIREEESQESQESQEEPPVKKKRKKEKKRKTDEKKEEEKSVKDMTKAERIEKIQKLTQKCKEKSDERKRQEQERKEENISRRLTPTENY